MRKKSVKRQGKTTPSFAAGASGTIATANHILLYRKLLFDFKKPFDLIPHFVLLEKNKNNNLEKFNSIENRPALRDSNHLKSPINTGCSGNLIISRAENFPPYFLSKNRLNRQKKSNENSTKCGRRGRRKIVENNLTSVNFYPQNSESAVFGGLLQEVRTYFENTVAEIN